ncbi:Flp family type IVb pilin [Vibrio diazotrophicus]|uniref:Flp family type IVb pilin n=1 Tax=Vibrio diazotrophicus TaxID=685 RepID=A0A2J8I5S7_VIBDI|nr:MULTISPECIES: Flp family type IVb pilin [Vibrio]MCF7361913.1 Flp family type IVb pilin [Vibrio sp. A1-b2]PNI05883.1 Flp family type IVb pilin [Vibrio diazotrophicus]
MMEKFKSDEEGVTAVEYAIVAVVMSAIVLAAFTTENGIRDAIENALQAVSDNLNSASDGGAE